MPMELFGRKGDCYQAITPQSNMGLSSKTLLIAILRMALDVLTAAQGGTCAIIKTECCVYIPDYHKNVTGLIKDMNAQIKALQGPSLSLRKWISSWFEGGPWPTIKNLFLGVLILIALLILICCFVQCFSTWCRDSIAAMTSP
uniref:Uncharacterized protein n=1 Tax=Mustela putorius furo TaxID=9669 RepID=M3XYJ5_MUSPF